MANILITGGGMRNKGAQAMTFIAVDCFSREFPEDTIYLMPNQEKEITPSEKEKYRFQFVPGQMHKYGFSLLRGWYRLKALFSAKERKASREVKGILKNTRIIADISGYAIGSDWGIPKSIMMAYRAQIARNYGADMIYMPQSFGPFDFKGLAGAAAHRLIPYWLGRARVIYAREEEGYEYLTRRYKLKNVKKSCDMVLQSKEVEEARIYKKPADRAYRKLEDSSVGIVPNRKNFQFGSREEIIQAYRLLIEELLSRGETVYLFWHSTEDAGIGKEIKALFPEETRVIFVERELDCIEVCRIFPRLKLLIASRYHSAVHAYKCSVPCIVLGWAVKYRELMELFGQEKYMFDVRSGLNMEKLLSAVREVLEENGKLKQEIGKRLEELQERTVFDEL